MHKAEKIFSAFFLFFRYSNNEKVNSFLFPQNSFTRFKMNVSESEPTELGGGLFVRASVFSSRQSRITFFPTFRLSPFLFFYLFSLINLMFDFFLKNFTPFLSFLYVLQRNLSTSFLFSSFPRLLSV